MISASSAAARSASSLTTTWSNSSAAATSPAAMARRRAMASSLSVPLPRSRRAELVQRRRRDEHERRLGHDRADGARPAQLDLEDHVVAARRACPRPRDAASRTGRRCILPTRGTPPRPTSRSKASRVRKWYSRPSTSPGRGARVVADTDIASRVEARAEQADDGPLPGARRPRDDEDARNALSLRRRRAARSADARTGRPPSCWG